MSGDELGRSRTVTWDDPHVTAAGAAGRTGLQFLQAMAAGELPAPPIMHTVGAWLESVEPGKAVFALEPAEYHYNPIGSVHGGIFAVLLDSAAGCAVHSVLDVGVSFTSIDLSVKFLGAMRADTGIVRCTGSVPHLGTRTALAEAKLETASGRLLATAASSCLLR